MEADVIRPEITLFGGASVHPSARKFSRFGAVNGLSVGSWSLLGRGPVSVLVIFIFLCCSLLSQDASVLDPPGQVTASLLPQ